MNANYGRYGFMPLNPFYAWSLSKGVYTTATTAKDAASAWWYGEETSSTDVGGTPPQAVPPPQGPPAPARSDPMTLPVYGTEYYQQPGPVGAYQAYPGPSAAYGPQGDRMVHPGAYAPPQERTANPTTPILIIAGAASVIAIGLLLTGK